MIIFDVAIKPRGRYRETGERKERERKRERKREIC